MTIPTQPKARLVLLGASNLTMGFATALANARAVLGTDALEVHAALGHGRSYGLPSRVLFRSLPAIKSCGLWSALEELSPLPTYAVVSDLGNDIAYGVEPATLLSWAEVCLRRLRQVGARVVLSSLPRGRLRELRDWEIHLVRHLLFPSSNLSPAEARRRIGDVDAGLEALASREGLAWVETEPSCYRLDPMHVRRRSRPGYWRRLFLPLGDGENPVEDPCRGSYWGGWRLLARAPERRWLFGLERYRRQSGYPFGAMRIYFY